MARRSAYRAPGVLLRLLLLALLCPFPAAAQRLEDRVREHTLANGMKFLFVERHDAPVFTGEIVFRVGGVDEQVGATGLAHMFEHMAFKGTRTIGTRDYQKEVPILDALDRAAQALRLEQAKGDGADPKRIEALRKEMQALQEKHRALIVPDEFTDIYSRNGGADLNASTGKDTTEYHVSLPSNRLELWMLMESQRIAEPVLREFYTERDVVAEERRMRFDNDPGGMLYEMLIGTAFVAHPYHFPIIGWASDIQSLTADQARAFRRVYYVPNNAVGAVVGDINTDQAIALAKKYFGSIPAGPPPPPVVTIEPPQRGEKRINIAFEAEPMLMMAYHKPTAPTADDIVFDVIDGIISSGRTSRLYDTLVNQKRVAAAVDTFQGVPGFRYPNLWGVFAVPLAPHTAADVEAAIDAEIERLQKEPVSARELEKVKNQIEAAHIRALDSNAGLALDLAETQAIVGDWRYITRQRDQVQKVTAEDVQRVARRYLVRENRTVGTLVRKAPDAASRVSDLRPAAARFALPLRLGFRPEVASAASRATRTSGMRAANQAPSPKTTPRPDAASPKPETRDPRSLKFPPLKFDPPDPVRRVLPNGMVLYLLEDRELPLFQAVAYVNVGSIYEPAGKVGLAELTGTVMRTGGTEKRTGDELNQTLEFLAATVETSIGEEFGTARVSTLRKDAETGMEILADVLRRPAFRQEKLDLAKQQAIEGIRRRNDDPAAIAQRAFLQAVYGPESPWARQPTAQGIAGITRDDLVAFHARFFAPNNIILAASGDMSADDMARLVEQHLGDWARRPVEFPAVAPVTNMVPGNILVTKDVTQSNIRMGHLGLRRHSPDRYAARVMDYILGLDPFISRLGREVRTRRGLAYSVWSSLGEGRDLGVFEMAADTQVPSTVPAITAMREILTRFVAGPVTAQEMSAAKESLLNAFVFRFQSRAQIVSQRAMLEMLGFAPDYLKQYQGRIAAVTPADVQRVARQYLHPDRMVTVVVGPPDLEKPLAAFGPVRRIAPEQVP